jgi:hypothetical protein
MIITAVIDPIKWTKFICLVWVWHLCLYASKMPKGALIIERKTILVNNYSQS